MECGDSHTDRAEDGGPGGEMVRKARWRQERLVQRKPNKVSKSMGLVLLHLQIFFSVDCLFILVMVSFAT